jgi:hypothetical protein
MPMALIGAIFLGLAGASHAASKGRGQLQNLAMVSDFLIAAVLVICCLLRAPSSRLGLPS